MQQVPTGAHSTATGDIAFNLTAFEHHLRSERKAPSTVVTYRKAIDQLAVYLAEQGMPREVSGIRREHVEAFLIALQERGLRPATVAQRFRSLQQFFKWLAAEGELHGDGPMVRMRPPNVPEEPPAVITLDQLRTLLRASSGVEFEDRRDTAIVMLFLDTGIRRAELAGIRVEDLDLAGLVVHVVGKGSRPRTVPFENKTARAIVRYIRARANHRAASSEWLWLGQRDRLTDTGIAQLLKRRARQAGLEHIHPHQFRHTFAHMYLDDGGNETDLMRLAGWKSRQMVSRYGASAADQRARDAYRRHSPSAKL